MATGTIETIPLDVQPGSVVIRRNVSWDDYEQFLEEIGERRLPHSYVNGELRFMAPGINHESAKKWMAQLVEALTNELRLPRRSIGSLTLKLGITTRGAEPDEGYLIANAPKIQGRHYDYTTDPPPDLLIEIDMTSPSLKRLPVYASLGVPEVWVYDGEQLRILLRKDDENYEVSQTSKAFPTLPMEEFAPWIEKAYEIDEMVWFHNFCEWVRENVKQPD